MASNTRAAKGKNAPPTNEPLTSTMIPTSSGPGDTRSIRSPTPLTEERISEIIAEQLAVAIAALRASETPTQPHVLLRTDSQSSDHPLISIEPTNREYQSNGPMRGNEAQELSDGTDPIFDSWRLQILARFRDDPYWYNSDRRKLDYMLRRTKGSAQIHMLSGMKDEQLPGYFETADDALASLSQALNNPEALRIAKNSFRALQMLSSETFAEFRTRFLLLAQESQLPTKFYREELFQKITPELGYQITPLQNLLITYDQLSDTLLSTDTGNRWFLSKSALSKRTSNALSISRNPAGRFTPAANPVIRSSSTPFAQRAGTPGVSFQASTPNLPYADHSKETCWTCGKSGHRSPECSQSKAPRHDLKELDEQEDELSEEEALGKEQL
jgi:hypothetical protein